MPKKYHPVNLFAVFQLDCVYFCEILPMQLLPIDIRASEFIGKSVLVSTCSVTLVNTSTHRETDSFRPVILSAQPAELKMFRKTSKVYG